ncbi:MAG: PEP-CTERM sorting domain-containing protein [Massilia sp.]|nr:PEP-CTERM sorting domain-containing protein [Massilia sp.]
MKTAQKKILLISIFLPVALASSMAKANTSTFANFFDNTGSKKFIFNNNTTTKSGSFSTSMDPVTFNYASLNVDAALQGPLRAHLTMTSSQETKIAAFKETQSKVVYQAIDGITTMVFNLDTPYRGLKNLLTVKFSRTSTDEVYLSGLNGSSNSTLTADNEFQDVTYTSDFLNFSYVTGENFALSFSGQTPKVGINLADGLLNSFSSDGVGTFAAAPLPAVIVLPEPESSAILLAGLGVMGFMHFRRKTWPSIKHPRIMD